MEITYTEWLLLKIYSDTYAFSLAGYLKTFFFCPVDLNRTKENSYKCEF